MAKERKVSVSATIEASPEAIFAIIDDPTQHAAMDGSGTVKGSRQASTHLTLGDRFGMDMRLGIPYRIASKVVEYEAGRRLAWAHFGGHRWRYELEPLGGATRVTETFDWSSAKFPPFIELMRYPAKHVGNMERTLENLARLAEGKAN